MPVDPEHAVTDARPVSVLKRLKQGTLSAARGSGVLSLARESAWRARRLLILGYHGISSRDEHEWDGELYIPPALLRRRLSAIRDGGYTVLPLDEAVRRLYEGTLPPRAIALTFDDGAYDFYTEALPILEAFDFPATVYLTSYYCTFQRPVFNTMLRYVLWKANGRTLDLTGLTESGREVTLSGPAEREATFGAIAGACNTRGLSAAAKDAVIATVASRLGIDYPALLNERFLHLMSRDDVSRLPRELIDVQLHTHRHRVPTERTSFTREIDENREIIRDITGASATHFCYPSGVTNAAFPEWLRDLGVVSATTCFPGIASPASDPLMLPRLIDTTYVSDIEFESWLTGASAFLPRRRVRAVVPA
jgi:peptidoglycan/xylan/chitin deacetylase (PgdA/CDA1 family)